MLSKTRIWARNKIIGHGREYRSNTKIISFSIKNNTYMRNELPSENGNTINIMWDPLRLAKINIKFQIIEK